MLRKRPPPESLSAVQPGMNCEGRRWTSGKELLRCQPAKQASKPPRDGRREGRCKHSQALRQCVWGRDAYSA